MRQFGLLLLAVVSPMLSFFVSFPRSSSGQARFSSHILYTRVGTAVVGVRGGGSERDTKKMAPPPSAREREGRRNRTKRKITHTTAKDHPRRKNDP